MDKKTQEKILDILQKKGCLDEKWRSSTEKPLGPGVDLFTRLLDEKMVKRDDLLSSMSVCFGIVPVILSRIEISPDIRNLIPDKISHKYKVIAVSRIDDFLTVAISDPSDIMALDDVKTVTGCEISVLLALRKDIEASLSSGRNDDLDVDSILDANKDIASVEMVSRDTKLEEFDLSADSAESGGAPIVKIVSVIISEAIKRRASDIHIEPQEKHLRIRYRIDGELQEAFELPQKNQGAVTTRIKIMSNIDITDSRTTQDGRFRIKMSGKEIDFRVSVLPTVFGNKIVLRALDKSNLSVGLESLGFLPEPLADFNKAIASPYGIILVTGPTGSGKSTTLYSVLSKLNVPEKNIITVEDPVEYQVQGITQVPVSEDIGLGFSEGLRSILRQTPDIILIGEIRDQETADIAIKASLTGHLVLTTLHTNDSVGAITRLINMGVEPFLISSSLIMCCAQRLLRKICPYCKTEMDLSPEIRQSLEGRYPAIRNVKSFYTGKGCAKCNNTGYRGRLAAIETMMMDEDLARLINKGASEEEIKKNLRSKGFKNLRENAIRKFCSGDTTLQEVYRVT
ncbi:MAG: type II/IV secretion system protein [Candidatus Omnitrophica bacterium]|nr:type II/IV secretion system protein [Candidatus Omnitrophota bacterium]